MKLLGKLVSFFDKFNRLLILICGIVVIILMLLTSYGVIARYSFNSPLQWGNEVSEYMLFAIPMLGAAWLLKRGGHVKVDALLERLKPRPRAICKLVTLTICVIVCLIIAWYGAASTWENFVGGIRIPKILPVPKFILLAFIPLCFLLLTIEFARQWYQSLVSLKKSS